MRFWMALLCCMFFVEVKAIKLAYGRLALIDTGAQIQSEILVDDPHLLRAYAVSGHPNEKLKSIIVLHGLEDKGSTNISVMTSAGIKQYSIELNSKETQDYIEDPSKSRSFIVTEIFDLGKSTIVRLPNYVNEYIFAGNPNCLKLNPLVKFYDPEFLKIFALQSLCDEVLTDLVIPTQDAVIKINLKFYDQYKNSSNIDLRNFLKSSQSCLPSYGLRANAI